MSRRIIDKEALVAAIKQSQELSDEQKADIIELIRTQKKYGLVWEDSPEDAVLELKTKLPILREVTERRILNDADGELYPNHILIEGENLQALVALSYTHASMIDVIYIDPPYNTGHNDFTYNDSCVDSEDAYRHSKWLSFMEKRLKIAKALLAEKGMIFISIDDNEDAQLKLLCDEIFMNKNKVADVIWQSRKSVSNDTFVSQNHNYTLIYAKNIDLWDKSEFRLPSNAAAFENRDNDPRGPWVADPFDAPNIRPNLTYAIINPNTGEEFWPPKGRCWRTTEEQYKEYLADNRIVFGKKGTSKPQLKRFQDFAMAKGETPTSIWNDIETTTNGTQLLQSIFGGEKVFSNPKPVELIKRVLILMRKKDLKILDFFAGSGTTLHATMQLNAEDGGHRQCILVTNNENGICENVTYERNKRVIQGYTTPKGLNVPGLTKNNLRYYKLKAVRRDSSTRSRMKLAAGSVDMLNIMENLYKEKDGFGDMGYCKGLRYFEENGRGMLVLLNTDLIPKVVEQLKQMEPSTPVHIYLYAPGDYAFNDEFEDVADKVELYPLPQPILNAYKNCLPKQDEVMLDVPDDYELSEAELNESAKDFISKED